MTVIRTAYKSAQRSDERSIARTVPESARVERRVAFDATAFPLYEAATALLRATSFGRFVGGQRLEDFRVDVSPRKAQKALTRAVLEDAAFLTSYERFVVAVVLPELRRWSSMLYYQYPPTMRIQPGPSIEAGRLHSDRDYGHQDGEINIWLPLTSFERTRTALVVESAPGVGDFHPLDCEYGEFVMWYGSRCAHHAPPNSSPHTRVSLDFRVALTSSDAEPFKSPLAFYSKS